MAQTQQDLKERPIGELLKQLSQETATLVRQEMDLAKAELKESGKKAGVGVGLFGAAGIVGFLTLATLTTTVILVLNIWIPAWAAAGIVTILYAIAAGVLALQGKERVKEAAPPAEQTVETVKEDIEWAKHPTTSAGR